MWVTPSAPFRRHNNHDFGAKTGDRVWSHKRSLQRLRQVGGGRPCTPPPSYRYRQYVRHGSANWAAVDRLHPPCSTQSVSRSARSKSLSEPITIQQNWKLITLQTYPSVWRSPAVWPVTFLPLINFHTDTCNQNNLSKKLVLTPAIFTQNFLKF